MKKITTLLLILAVIVGLLLVFKAKSFSLLPSLFFDNDRAAVIKDIQELGRLETASFTIEKIIEAGTEGNNFHEILYGDRILLIAHGNVIAGIDMTKITESDIQTETSTIIVNLPAPEIFFTQIDNQQTRVYDRDQGLLSKGNKDLEAQARQQAETSIQAAACEDGILNVANESAKKQLEAFLGVVGFEEVVIQTLEGSCSN